MNDLAAERTTFVIAAEINMIAHQTKRIMLAGTIEIGRRLKDFEKKFQVHLTKILLNLGREHLAISTNRLRRELLAASNVLLNYQRSLPDGQQIERPEEYV